MDISRLSRKAECEWHLPATGAMRVPGVIYADEALLRSMDEKVPEQVANVAALPGIVKASGNTPVLFDSGIRSGTEVIKALALGATAVGIGRPYAYGLALDGVEGIVHVLRCILAEADLLMAVDGYPRIADLEPTSLMAVS